MQFNESLNKYIDLRGDKIITLLNIESDLYLLKCRLKESNNAKEKFTLIAQIGATKGQIGIILSQPFPQIKGINHAS